MKLRNANIFIILSILLLLISGCSQEETSQYEPQYSDVSPIEQKS